jgi:tRNA pseudouridine13 synthase
MKLKRLREDFVVHDVSNFPLGSGSFAVYRLDKSGIGTPEAIAEILKVWNLPRRAVGYGGLKDRHATTTQTITLFKGPQRSLEQRGFLLEYLGQAPREFHAKDIVANRFEIALRDLQSDAADRMESLLPAVAAGVPNYFDDQRFGSLGESGQFIAHPWCLGDYERALYLAIAEANVHDRPREREQKSLLRELWGRWDECKQRLDRSHRRSIVTYLVDHPTDFRRALALLRSDLRSIAMAAFQSYLWNEVVSQWLQQNLPAGTWYTRPGAAGLLTFWSEVSPETSARLVDLEIPLPSARQRHWPEGIEPLLERVLEPLGMQRAQIRVKYPRDTFFSKGSRRVLLKPEELTWQRGEDELAPGRHKLMLKFTLPRGAYATMVVKCLLPN